MGLYPRAKKLKTLKMAINNKKSVFFGKNLSEIPKLAINQFIGHSKLAIGHFKQKISSGSVFCEEISFLAQNPFYNAQSKLNFFLV